MCGTSFGALVSVLRSGKWAKVVQVSAFLQQVQWQRIFSCALHSLLHLLHSKCQLDQNGPTWTSKGWLHAWIVQRVWAVHFRSLVRDSFPFRVANHNRLDLHLNRPRCVLIDQAGTGTGRPLCRKVREQELQGTRTWSQTTCAKEDCNRLFTFDTDSCSYCGTYATFQHSESCLLLKSCNRRLLRILHPSIGHLQLKCLDSDFCYAGTDLELNSIRVCLWHYGPRKSKLRHQPILLLPKLGSAVQCGFRYSLDGLSSQKNILITIFDQCSWWYRSWKVSHCLLRSHVWETCFINETSLVYIRVPTQYHHKRSIRYSYYPNNWLHGCCYC